MDEVLRTCKYKFNSVQVKHFCCRHNKKKQNYVTEILLKFLFDIPFELCFRFRLLLTITDS